MTQKARPATDGGRRARPRRPSPRAILGAACLAACGVVLGLQAAPAQAKLAPLAEIGERGTGPGQFNGITGLAVDRAGNLFAADLRGIQVFRPDGRFRERWHHEFEGFPADLATDASGHLYAVDTGGPYESIEKFTPSGRHVMTFGAPATADNRFFVSLERIAVDDRGFVYALGESPTLEDRVIRFSPSGELIGIWGQDGSASDEFSRPESFGVDGGGDVFVVEEDTDDLDRPLFRVQKFTAEGDLLDVWRVPAGGRSSRCACAFADLGVDRAGNLYVTDAYGDSIHKLSGRSGRVMAVGEVGSDPLFVAVEPGGNFFIDRFQHETIVKYGVVPFLTITSGPRGRTRGASHVFAWTSDEPGTTFQCRLDKGSWQPCSSPKGYANLRPGDHTFRVRGILGGNVGGAASRSFEIVDGSGLPVEKLRIKRRKKTFLTIECPPTPCQGKLTIKGKVKRRHLARPAARGKKGTRKINFIKKRRYSVPAGGAKRYKLKLTKPARKVLKKKRKLVGVGVRKADGGGRTKFKAVLKR